MGALGNERTHFFEEFIATPDEAGILKPAFCFLQDCLQDSASCGSRPSGS